MVSGRTHVLKSDESMSNRIRQQRGVCLMAAIGTTTSITVRTTSTTMGFTALRERDLSCLCCWAHHLLTLIGCDICI